MQFIYIKALLIGIKKSLASKIPLCKQVLITKTVTWIVREYVKPGRITNQNGIKRCVWCQQWLPIYTKEKRRTYQLHSICGHSSLYQWVHAEFYPEWTNKMAEWANKMVCSWMTEDGGKKEKNKAIQSITANYTQNWCATRSMRNNPSEINVNFPHQRWPTAKINMAYLINVRDKEMNGAGS